MDQRRISARSDQRSSVPRRQAALQQAILPMFGEQAFGKLVHSGGVYEHDSAT